MISNRRSFQLLFHNLVCHPVAGVCWFVGLDDLGDKIHNFVLVE